MDRAAMPEESLGGFISITGWDQANRVGSLFPDVNGRENEGGLIDLRCLFVRNDHQRLPLMDAVLWVEAKARPGADIELAVDPTPASDPNADAPQALTDPSALRWSAAQGEGKALRLGTLGPAQVKAFWIKRSVLGVPAVDRDFFVLRVRGDTAQ